jgi:hypothetical protein
MLNYIGVSMKQAYVCIAGSRIFSDYTYLVNKVDKALSNLKATHKITIVSGGAYGADKLGEKYAKAKGYRIRRFIPNWGAFGRQAGMMRNIEMMKFLYEQEDKYLIAFWNGESKGTKHMIDICESVKIPCKVYTV